MNRAVGVALIVGPLAAIGAHLAWGWFWRFLYRGYGK